MTIGEIQALLSSELSSSREGPQVSVREQVDKNREAVKAIKTIEEEGGAGPNSELRFAIDRGTGQPLIKVVNRVTNELIAQVPPEVILRVAETLRQLRGGDQLV